MDIDDTGRGDASVGSSSGPEEAARPIHPTSLGDGMGAGSLRGGNCVGVANHAADASPVSDIVSRLAYAVHHDAHPGCIVHIPNGGGTCSVFDNMLFHFDLAAADITALVAEAKRSAHLEDARAGCFYCSGESQRVPAQPTRREGYSFWWHVRGKESFACSRPEVWDALSLPPGGQK